SNVQWGNSKPSLIQQLRGAEYRLERVTSSRSCFAVGPICLVCLCCPCYGWGEGNSTSFDDGSPESLEFEGLVSSG
ncbi:hypothetical protein NPIL_637411, partial [Nephila pilipes]